MTLVDAGGKPIGDLPPRKKNVPVDLDAMMQRVAIAQGHPLESQRKAAKDLVLLDAALLIDIVKAQVGQFEELMRQHVALLENANTSNVLLALILAQEPEWRWPKDFVAAFEPSGSWDFGDDPAAPEHRWLLRMAPPEPIVSASEQTGAPDEPSGVEPREPAVGEQRGDDPAADVRGREHDGGSDEPEHRDQHDG